MAFYQYFTSYNFLGFHYGGNRLSGIFGDEQKIRKFSYKTSSIIVALASISKKIFLIMIILYYFYIIKWSDNTHYWGKKCHYYSI